MPSITVKVQNKRGLHARAAGKIVKLAENLGGGITLSRDGRVADATSIMDIVMLGAICGAEVTVTGPDPALIQMKTLFEGKFDEE